jgi:hypothetical protein
LKIIIQKVEDLEGIPRELAELDSLPVTHLLNTQTSLAENLEDANLLFEGSIITPGFGSYIIKGMPRVVQAIEE